MKRMKSVIAGVLALSMAMSMAACGSKASGSSESSGASKPAASVGTSASGKADYAVVLKVLSTQFWQNMRSGIEAEAKKQNVKVDIFAANTEDDVEGQVSLLENAISKGYKAIGVAPISNVNLNNAIADATKKGIRIVNIDAKIDLNALTQLGGACYAYVSSDNKGIGKMGAEYLVKAIGGKGEVAIVEGKAGDISSSDRGGGAKSAFEAAGLKIVESQPADWDRTKAYDVVTNYITAHPDLKAIYCCNDTMAMGAQEAVTASGKDIKVCGTDGNQDAVQSVSDGKLSATVTQDSAAIGAMGLNLMIESVLKNAEIKPSTDIHTYGIDAILITKDNASKYLTK